MLLLGAILLAVFVLPSPWGVVAVIVGAIVEIAESALFIWWSKRRRAAVGVEALVGQKAVVATPSQVRVAGELWNARSGETLVPGTEVVVREVEGLTLVVDAR